LWRAAMVKGSMGRRTGGRSVRLYSLLIVNLSRE
jgi:hypothetical protein